MDKMRTIRETALLAALCCALLVGTWTAGRHETLENGLIRLHVLARSDSAEDQAAKLRARDALLALLTPELEKAENEREAEALVRALLPKLAETARAAAGAESARVTLSREAYPVRYYDTFALPAGVYRSLRVELDGGAGHNWWCVVYPPLCMQSVSDHAEEAAVLDGGDWSFLEPGEDGYEIRFRLLELWGRWTGR